MDGGNRVAQRRAIDSGAGPPFSLTSTAPRFGGWLRCTRHGAPADGTTLTFSSSICGLDHAPVAPARPTARTMRGIVSMNSVIDASEP